MEAPGVAKAPCTASSLTTPIVEWPWSGLHRVLSRFLTGLGLKHGGLDPINCPSHRLLCSKLIVANTTQLHT